MTLLSMKGVMANIIDECQDIMIEFANDFEQLMHKTISAVEYQHALIQGNLGSVTKSARSTKLVSETTNSTEEGSQSTSTIGELSLSMASMLLDNAKRLKREIGAFMARVKQQNVNYRFLRVSAC